VLTLPERDGVQGVRSEDVRKLRESVVQYLVSSPGGGLTLPLRPLLESWLDDKNNFSSENPGHTFDIKDDGNLGLLFVIYCRVWALTQADTVVRFSVVWCVYLNGCCVVRVSQWLLIQRLPLWTAVSACSIRVSACSIRVSACSIRVCIIHSCFCLVCLVDTCVCMLDTCISVLHGKYVYLRAGVLACRRCPLPLLSVPSSPRLLTVCVWCVCVCVCVCVEQGRGGGWKLDALSLAKTLQSGLDLSAAHGGRWRQLASLTLNLHLSSMPTSFQDDLAIQANLDQSNPPEGWSGDVDNLATALRFRIAHKKILLDAIQSLEEDA